MELEELRTNLNQAEDKLLYYLVLRYAKALFSDPPGWFTPDVIALRKETGLSQEALLQAFAGLVRKGWLKQQREHSRCGPGQSKYSRGYEKCTTTITTSSP